MQNKKSPQYDNARNIALKILYDVDVNNAYSNLSLDKYLTSESAGQNQQSLSNTDRAFITELVYGTIKWKLRLDYIIESFSSIKLKKISPWIINILRMGLYQIFHMDRVPVSAAINESVKLAKRYGHEAASRFVNGLLRNADRRKAEIKFPDISADRKKSLSVTYSYPEWIIELWDKQLGESNTESLLAAGNEPPSMAIRVNTLKTTREELTEKLKSEGISSHVGKLCEDAFILDNPTSIRRLKSFNDGLFQVQDEGSMMVGRLADPRPGQLVIDVCAAPGGKSTHVAQLMKDRGRVISHDIHPHKIKLIDDNSKRLGLSIIEAELFDSTLFDKKYESCADIVIVDAPCTGLGIIRRKPDIKWAAKQTDMKEIISLQRNILDISSRYVKPGGKLVYSTCTINDAENKEVVDDFLSNHSDFTCRTQPMQLFPHIHGTDGFFICVMLKT